jgi:protein SCO1
MVPLARTTCCSISAVLALALSPGAGAHDATARARAASAARAAPHLAVIREAPDFALLDVEGRSVGLADLRGNVVLLSFLFTGCKSACPVISHRMASLQRRLAASGSASGVKLISVTIDPDHDTPRVLAAHARKLGARAGWHFVSEDAARTRAVLASYDEWTRRLSDGDLEHPARVHLIDRRGRVREIYSLEFFDEREAFRDIAALRTEP